MFWICANLSKSQQFEVLSKSQFFSELMLLYHIQNIFMLKYLHYKTTEVLLILEICHSGLNESFKWLTDQISFLKDELVSVLLPDHWQTTWSSLHNFHWVPLDGFLIYVGYFSLILVSWWFDQLFCVSQSQSLLTWSVDKLPDADSTRCICFHFNLDHFIQ